MLHFLKSCRARAGVPYDARERLLLERQEAWLCHISTEPIVTQLRRPKPTSDALRQLASSWLRWCCWVAGGLPGAQTWRRGRLAVGLNLLVGHSLVLWCWLYLVLCSAREELCCTWLAWWRAGAWRRRGGARRAAGRHAHAH